MPGKDPARGARDTGRTGRGIGDGPAGRDRAGGARTKNKGRTAIEAVAGGTVDPFSGRQISGAEHAAMNTRDAARKTKRDEARDRARGYKPGTLKPDEVPTYNAPPTVGQLLSAVSMSPTTPTGALSAIAAVAGAAAYNDPFGRSKLGKKVDDATGQVPGDYTGGTNISRESGRYGSPGNQGEGAAAQNEKDAEERRKRRLAAQQTALGSANNSLLGPGVQPI